MMKKKITLFALLCLFCVCSIFAEGENLTVKVAVMGPGDQLYFWWGHIALVIDDSITGRSRYYDYGLFSFEKDHFFYNFAFGRLIYNCGASSAENNIAGYIFTNRDITFYTLDLPPEVRVKVRDFAEENVLPQNSEYNYHIYKDNCSTRIRDIIDLATDGQFMEQYGEASGRFTLRQQIRRHTWFSPAGDWILNFWLGQDIDTPITIWQDMFIPGEVGKRIDEFYYNDSNGVRRKLVSKTEVLFRAKDRPIVLDAPRKQWPRELAFSLALSALFGFFFFLQAKNYRAGRILAGVSMSLTSLVFGIAGLLLYFMSIFTNHDYTFHNANMLFCSPLLLVAVPFGIRYALTKKPEKLFISGVVLRLIWLLTVVGVIISMLIKILPWFYQDNLTDQMLMLPIALVFTFQPTGLKEIIEKYYPRRKA